MKKSLFLLAATAAVLVPTLLGRHPAEADPKPDLRPADLLAAVNYAEAQRRAAKPAREPPAKAAADLDHVAGVAGKLDPDRIDPKLALNAIAR